MATRVLVRYFAGVRYATAQSSPEEDLEVRRPHAVSDGGDAAE